MSKLVRQIRAAIESNDGVDPVAMEPLAEAYAEEVFRVNERLQVATDLLQRGLRSEAIQSISVDPDAIDWAVDLDFPEIDQWYDVLSLYGLSLPPAIDRDAVEQISEAIVESQPIEDLLRRQRELAIARATLSKRLHVLRQIATLDPNTPAWRDDQSIWEKARLQELSGEVTAALDGDDQSKLRALQDELSDPRWIIPPPAKYLGRVNEEIAARRRESVLHELQVVAPELHDCLVQLDPDRGRALRARFDALTAELDADLPDEIFEQAEPAIEWLEQLDGEANRRRQREAAIDALESSLDREAPLEELQKVHARAMAFESDPPELLLRRYHVAVASLQLARRRKFQSIIGGILAATVVLIASLAWWRTDQSYRGRVSEAGDRMDAFLRGGDLRGAETFLTTLRRDDPPVAAAPRLAELAGRLDSLSETERGRRKQFARYLDSARNDDPSQIDLASLDRAADIASGEEERAAVFAIRRRRQRWKNDLAARQSAALLSDLDEVRGRLTRIENLPPDPSSAMAVAEVIETLDTMPTRHLNASSSAKRQIDAVVARARSMRSAIQQRMTRDRIRTAAEEKIRRSGSLEAFAASLAAYASALPRSELAGDYHQVSGERNLWDKALRFNDYAEAAGIAIANRFPADDIERFETAQELYKSAVGVGPLALPGSARERLDRRKDRLELLESVLGGLGETLFADLYTVVENGGEGNRRFIYKTYFERNRIDKFGPYPEDISLKQRRIETVGDASGGVASVDLRGDLKVLTEPHDTIRWLVSLYELRSRRFLTDWEGEFLKTAEELRRRPNLDATVKELLLNHLLAGAAEQSDYLSQALTASMIALAERDSKTGLWYAASPAKTRLDTDVRAAVTDALPALFRGRATPAKDIRQIAQLRYRWIGYLTRQPDGRFDVRVMRPSDGDGRLSVVTTTPGNRNRADWAVIGSVQDGVVSVDSAAGNLVAGRPVFYSP